MKTKLLFFFFLLFLAVPSKAENRRVINRKEKAVAFAIVPNAGMNLSHFYGDAGAQFGMRFGANLGVGANLRFLKRNAFSPVESGLLGVYGGIAFEMSGTTEASGSGIAMYNLAFPVLMQVYPLHWLVVEAGPEFFVNVGNAPNSTLIGSMQVSNISSHRAHDIKIALGLGARFGRFGVGLRYLVGVSNFSPSTPWKGNVLQLNVSYHIPIG